MAFSNIRSLRQRLIVMSAVLMAPLMLIVGVNVAITYAKVRETLDSVPLSAAAVSRQAIYATLVGAARYGVAIGDSFAQGVSSDFLQGSLAHNPGYSAVRVRVGDRSEFAIRPADRDRAAALEQAIDKIPTEHPDLLSPAFPAQAWFRPVAIGDKRGFGVRVRFEAAAGPADVVVVISNDMMRRVIEAVDDRSGAQVTLLAPDVTALAPTAEDHWLPGPGFKLADSEGATLGVGRDGESRVYAVKALAGPHAYVVAALDASATNGLRAQLPIAFLAPILGLLLISLALLRTLKTNVIDWIFGLDRDVRRSMRDSDARAIVSTRMPIEIENVARSFNEALDARNAREADLSNALAHNRMLTRELHHRVKNSLQLVQSYLALGARESCGPARAALAAAQCRAYILSSAYRRALAEGEMRPFEIDAFLADVASYASEVLRAPHQRVLRSFVTTAVAGIDEALPLGMIVVELIEKGLRAPDARVVAISTSALSDGAACIFVRIEEGQSFPRAGRLLVGLLRQIGASEHDGAGVGGVAYRFDLPDPARDPAISDPTHASPASRLTGNRTPPPTL